MFLHMAYPYPGLLFKLVFKNSYYSRVNWPDCAGHKDKLVPFRAKSKDGSSSAKRSRFTKNCLFKIVTPFGPVPAELVIGYSDYCKI